MEDREKPMVSISSIVIAANVAVCVFLLSESDLLKGYEFVYNFLYAVAIPALLISAFLLYLFVVIVGISLLKKTDEKINMYSGIIYSLHNHRFWIYKIGLDWSVYAFTFSIPVYFGALIATKIAS